MIHPPPNPVFESARAAMVRWENRDLETSTIKLTSCIGKRGTVTCHVRLVYDLICDDGERSYDCAAEFSGVLTARRTKTGGWKISERDA